MSYPNLIVDDLTFLTITTKEDEIKNNFKMKRKNMMMKTFKNLIKLLLNITERNIKI